MKNICSRCYYHEECLDLRYSNIRAKYMKRIMTAKDRDGNNVIYVEKCTKFIKRKYKIPVNKTKKDIKPLDK